MQSSKVDIVNETFKSYSKLLIQICLYVDYANITCL